MMPRIMRLWALWLTIAAVLGIDRAALAAPATAQHLAIQGVARDADDVLIPSGDLAVRIYTDALGSTLVYDSGTSFNGAISQGIFDVIVGAGTPLMLDVEQSYFLELTVNGTEVVGDAAGGRWQFYAGGGSQARPDLEARLAALEAVVGGPNATTGTSGLASGPTLRISSAFSDQHGLLGMGKVEGAAGGYSATSSLLAQPVTIRSAGSVQVELGPYYLYAPHPNPAIRSVKDVGNDQGRFVRVKWRADLRERPYNSTDSAPRITGYTIYRRVEPGQQAALRAAPVAEMGRVAEPFALPPGEWDVLGSFPATLDSAYQTVVGTLCDSTGAGLCATTFLVRGITDQVGIVHNSPIVSGYSVDNLAPGVPAGLTVQALGGGAQISWQPSQDADFQYFRVYRDPNPAFVPSPANLVQATAATQWNDPTHGSFTYKVTAVDFNGNESAPAIGTITVGVTDRVPASFGLASMAPNPFTHSLSLSVDVPEAVRSVNLALFDLAGRKVRVLVDGHLPAGRHVFRWDGTAQSGGRAAPGIYVVRLAGGGRTIIRRATLLP